MTSLASCATLRILRTPPTAPARRDGPRGVRPHSGQGDERAEYVDAFLTAGQRFGAKVMNLRLPYASSATAGEVGVWTVGKTPLSENQPAVEILKSADMVVETLFMLFSDELTEIQQAGTTDMRGSTFRPFIAARSCGLVNIGWCLIV
jgi:hypothetical protein